MPKTIYEVHGPFEMPVEKVKKTKRIDEKKLRRDFWKNPEAEPFKDKSGCYVFGMRHGKNITPWYVGKTEKELRKECSYRDKLYKYNEVLAKKNGAPILFLIARKRKGANAQNIEEMETFLISEAQKKNDELLNLKKSKRRWEIKNYTERKPGKARKEEKLFKGMMKVKKTKARTKPKKKTEHTPPPQNTAPSQSPQQ